MKAHPLNKASSKRTPGRRKATFLAKYRPDVFPKEPRTIKMPLHGKICSPCIQNALQSAVWEYISRVSCHQGALLPSKPLKSCMTSESCHARRIQLDESCHARRIPQDKSCHARRIPLDEPRHARWLHWANPAMLDGFTGRILSRSMVSIVQILPSRPGGSRWAKYA